MCGIAGFWRPSADLAGETLAELGQKMAEAVRHRGPDDSGTWVDAQAGICLAHRRLSIVDLSPHGHQPMVSDCGRYVVVYNGEIYNYTALRTELEEIAGHRSWRGHSDTEVLVAAVSHWGIDKTLDKLNGMFGFAVWDRVARSLTLARDRLGEKPLYYGWQGPSFLFGSELKALAVHTDWRNRLNAEALPLLMRFGQVPAAWSIFDGIAKLGAGQTVTIDATDAHRSLRPTAYWHAPVPSGSADMSDGEAIDRLDGLLRDAVGLRMHADVPLGAFLSGGVDSSTVVALMQAQATRPVKTFSIGFQEQSHNEAVYAGEVARHLGTDHTQLYVTAQDALDVVPKLPIIHDEPFADSSQIPTYLVAALTREHVTVALSGDGGDELFGGYNRHFQLRKIAPVFALAPGFVRCGMAGVLRALSPAAWDRLLKRVPGRLHVLLSGDRVHKMADVLSQRGVADIYKRLVSQWADPSAVVPGVAEAGTALDRQDYRRQLPDDVSWMMFIDLLTYLPNDILTKVDRATMAVSLESRIPLLDHRVVAFAAQVSPRQKFRDGQGKWLLRQVLYRYVDRSLIDRPKMGFAAPIETWLRGPLRDWAETLLDRRKLDEGGCLDAAAVRQMWAEHLSGRRNFHAPLWVVLMFQSWMDCYRPSLP